jgi:hypothetical protein
MIARFKTLDREFKHIPRGRGHEVAKYMFALAQIELFNLAQAICYQADPRIQHRLDEARRSFMSEVREHIQTKSGVLVARASRIPFWYDFLISPEVSNDFSLKGITISESTCYELEVAHGKQVNVVRNVTK